jgi:hypothetical protein
MASQVDAIWVGDLADCAPTWSCLPAHTVADRFPGFHRALVARPAQVHCCDTPRPYPLDQRFERARRDADTDLLRTCVWAEIHY